MTDDAANCAPPRFILASASPRRQELLRSAGYEFGVVAADVDESAYPAGMLPTAIAVHLAETKAKAIAAQHPDCVVLAADTVVAFGDIPLGKPKDEADARRMLLLLSGTTHLVITAVTVAHTAESVFKTVRTMSGVRMRFLTPAELDNYIASGEWIGKAGGYGIQDRDPFVTRIAGSHTNIVGLPMGVAKRLLAEAGVKPKSESRP
ncbi:MAG TPA: Maf family protein [Tepidisphaeraceae bacterium]|nr:Maf family protein [Tepidisphaeraceae bacterium]